ncbi:MAG TPA: HAD family hydrolase [Micromonosporaceae bacterium]|nr:HAD family hydrolase [Micromonosporaceae bacterium]
MSVDTVIFDWGGTLTPWKTIDFTAAWRAVADRLVRVGQLEPAAASQAAEALAVAEDLIWRRSRDEHRSGSLDELFAAAGLAATPEAHAAVFAEWEHATFLDPEAPEMLACLRERGIRVGVLSNTTWPRRLHERIFRRDGVLHLIDGAVYTCEVPWTKPHPEAFRAAMAAVAAEDPTRCVFVGDRPFDDIYGAKRVGMRAVLVPHSTIPAQQRGHTDGAPDAVIARLADLIPLLDAWRSLVA